MLVYTVADIIYFWLTILLLMIGGSIWLVCSLIEIYERINKKSKNKEKEE